ncbi:putative protein kinase RLK-Pelle-CrRLK1L-1 family [Helianthus annuus]|uniref:non-specific serine/threonine protein kinase n=1 Tax=Helianthus annuus TaxID=4232 RepID=A0A9K3NBX6_HELAN|nr:putative protein kinase RLK-Pelle-CrRLK1L-1 family [Helianthus annuus]KAJ0900248.1 putative protein kinase RLK-Pelle-CrRLK1L-1 family [Helianthus annuus]
MSSIEEMKHLQISLQELSDATNAFSEQNLIAKGGFGKVYKGISVNHGNIAIKMLDPRLGQGDHEFKTEIALLSVYKHENIVSLLGFCDEDGKKVLVYKYESNGSLDKHLNNPDLTWDQRLKICIDVAQGLRYLHDDVGSQHRILHRDVKSSNILLDENWKAKITDFGLSRVGPANMQSTFVLSNVCGTIGYIDPDYYHTGYLTQKSDVYSFGVVLFEVLCGRLTRLREYMDERQFLTLLIKIHWRRKTLDTIIYSYIREQINEASLVTFSSIAYRCLMCPNERPTMSQVVKQLENALHYQQTNSNQLNRSLPSSSQSIPSSLSFRPWSFDVFISFNGEGTCETFAHNLFLALKRRQVITFKVRGEIPREETIPQSLLLLIEESRIAIIIFSRNYARSSRRLNELAFIMKNKDVRGKVVIPVFYDVKPSEVKSQTSYYREALAMHELNYNYSKGKVESWKKALAKASDLSGWDVASGDESEHIQKMVGRISSELFGLMQHSKESADTGLIGIQARKQELKLLLDVGTGGVRIVGISGMWGSGKSTLALSIYDEIIHEFKGCCFVQNVRARSRMHGLKMLQEEILSNVLKEEVTLMNLEQGISMMARRLCQSKVLIVLDDVDHADHLDMLVGSDNWFGEGSRIIFTTRNQDLVTARSSLAHNVRMLDDEEAIELFSRRAFWNSKPAQGFEEVSRNMVSKFGGHPAALIQMGRILHDKNEWKSILDRLEGRPVNEILKEFKTFDDGLVRNFFPRFLT